MKRGNKHREKNITVLGKETVFDGVMKFSESLQIEGKFIWGYRFSRLLVYF